MRIIATLVVLCLVSPAWAEIVHLTDGTSVTGSVKRQGDGWIVTTADGKSSYLSSDRVAEIELTSKFTNPADAAESQLEGLRNATQNSSDVDSVIKRYQDFIAQNKDTPSVAEAQKDLAVWQERKDRGLTRIGSKWVTKDEAGTISQESVGVAEQARNLMKQGRFKEAQPLIQQALADDPKNASAMYLQGLLDYQGDNVPAARRDFEGVEKLVPDHGPTLNNLAVILHRQNANPAAMLMYDRAMVASPMNKQIISNVDELLNGMTPEQKATPIAMKMTKTFTDQESQLEQKMLALGYYKWGATWVDRTQYDALKQQEAEIRAKLDALSTDYDNTQGTIDRLEREIDDNMRVMTRIDAMSYATDTSGQLIRTLPPKSYYDLDADNRKLSSERTEAMAKLDTIREQAKEVQQRLPTPRYTGLQQLIGIEGTPLLTAMTGASSLPEPVPASKTPEAAPTTEPATHTIFDK